MSLNPDGTPAYFYQAGATAYLIDPAGAYSPAGASAPTTDPAVTDDAGTEDGLGASVPTLAAAGVYVPIARTSSAAAEIVDPEGAYSLAGADAPTTDRPAGTDGGAGASPPKLAAAGAYIPITEASSAAEILDPEGANSSAGASAPMSDLAGRRNPVGAGAPTLAASGTYTPAIGATSAAEIGAYSLAGAGAAVTDPAGGDRAASASAPTLAAPGASIPATGATSAAAQILSLPGTYIPPGQTTPVADPPGTHSGVNATAPTTDSPGTYSSPYALNRLFVIFTNTTPSTSILSFQNEDEVALYYGATSPEASLAKEFFATASSPNYTGTANMMFTRFGLGQRPHLLGANIGSKGLPYLQSISGSIAVDFNGYTYSGHVNLSGATSFLNVIGRLRNALNSNLQVAAVTSGSSIKPVTVTFMGYVNKAQLYVTQMVSSGTIQPGGVVSGAGVKVGSQIIDQHSGVHGGAGHYSFLAHGGSFLTPELMTETYGVLTVGAVDSGTVALGQEVTGANVPTGFEAIDKHLGGSGQGSQWILKYAPTGGTVTGDMTMMATPLQVDLNWDNQAITGNNGAPNDFYDIMPQGSFGFDRNPSTLSYATGTAAEALGLTQGQAILSSPGGQHPSVAQFMDQVVQEAQSQGLGFSSFQSDRPQSDKNLAAWAQSTHGQYTFLNPPGGTTRAAGSSKATIDPAGTYSPAGAGAPTPAPAGTFINFAGATAASQATIDQPGTYSLAGASAPTQAQPGFYVPTAGASFETPDDPGFYTPSAGMSAELQAVAPAILVPQGQTDAPFSQAMITDNNTGTTDSLTIQITGGGGKLSDGAGFNGLKRGADGVYILSGTAAKITSELEALVFTPKNLATTTTFILTDTSSADPNLIASANTTVTVTTGKRVSTVANFLANQGTLDKIPGGFDILDTAANITANLHKLHDSHIHAIVVSDNGNVGASIQQLTTNATAIGKLQNANPGAPVRLAITDTVADIQAALSTLAQDASKIASITSSDGPIVVSAATFRADRPALDKIVGGFDVSDKAATLAIDLNKLNDPNISTITISDNGPITVSVAQLTTDATAFSKLKNGMIATNGTTTLAEVGNVFELNPAGGGTGPLLKLNGSVVTAGEFPAGWTPVGAVQTAGGYEVAWSVPGKNEYAVWNTDSNGNFTSSETGVTPGAPPALWTINTNGATNLVQVGNNYELEAAGAGTGPLIRINGSAVTAGQFPAGWTPVGAVKTSTGYEVAWSIPGANEFVVWNTGSNGDFTSTATGILSGTSPELEAVEAAFGELFPGASAQLAIHDTAGEVQTGLSTVVQDTGEIGSINETNNPFVPIVVSAATFQADQSTLDKINGGFDVSDGAGTLLGVLPALNADPHVDAITAEIGAGTLFGGVGVNAPSFSESGWATTLTVSEALVYGGAFTQGLGSALSISSGDQLSLTGTAKLSGTTSGLGTLALGGSAKINKGAKISVSNWLISGGTEVTLNALLNYPGSFSEVDDTFFLSGGNLVLSGAATFAGGTVDGSKILYTTGTTTVSAGLVSAGLRVGGTVEWINTGALTQSGGTVTIGDASGGKAILNNETSGIYNITDDNGIGLGSSTTSNIKNIKNIKNEGLFEKTGVTTGGTGTSVIAPNINNNGTNATIEVAAGTLDLQGGVSGTGSDTISGPSTLEFDSTVAAGQTVSFTGGSGGELALHAPGAFAGSISGFDMAGASNDTIEIAKNWDFLGFTPGTGQGTLDFKNSNSGGTIDITLIGSYTAAGFHATGPANGPTLITYHGTSGLKSLHLSAGGAHGEWGVAASWTGSVGHGPGPS